MGMTSYTSPSGIGASWTAHASPDWLYPILAFGNGVFRMAGATSADGATWTPATTPTIPGENSGFRQALTAAVYGGPAGLVAAERTAGGGIAFATHP